ncbi:MAG: BrnT family toxin [Anaerolineae bacterium]
MNPPIEFEWDADKAERNIKRHRIAFEEAVTAFDDNLALIFEDETHSFDEPRELLIGHSNRNRLLLIVFTERGAYSIRLISARLANGKEHKQYEQEKRF